MEGKEQKEKEKMLNFNQTISTTIKGKLSTGSQQKGIDFQTE